MNKGRLVEWRTPSSYTISDGSETRGRRFDGFSRLLSKCAAAGGAARRYKQASPDAALRPLFVRHRPTDDAFPFKMMSYAHMPYFVISCHVGGQKRGLNNNVETVRR